GKISRLLEILHRQNPGHDRNVNAAGADAIEVAEVEIVIEEELRDGAGSTGVDLGFQRIDIRIEARAFRMLLGIGGDRDFNVWITLLDASDQIGGSSVAFRVRRVSRAEPAGGVAAQRHDMADANLVISRHHLIDIAAWRVNAGEMRRRREAGFGEDAGNGRVGAFPGRTAGAIGHRNEIGGKWREAADGLPETALHLFGFGRKKFKRDRGRERAAAIGRGGCNLGHETTNSTSLRRAKNRPMHTGSDSPSYMGNCPLACETDGKSSYDFQ